MAGSAVATPPRVRHISYASPNYSRAARELRASASRFGLETFIYTREHPVVAALRRDYPEIMAQKRGGGYWLWKPAIILDALERSTDDTIAFYTDAGMHFIADPTPLLAHAHEHPIMLFEHAFSAPEQPPTFPQRNWTKRDCFVLLDADTPEHWDMQQVMSGVQIYRNSPQTRNFLREVLSATADGRVVTDQPNVMGFPNHPGFQEHRHDQSVLTIIGQRHKLPHFPDPTHYGFPAPRPAVPDSPDGVQRPATNYGHIFHLHRKPDRGPLNIVRGWISGIDPGIWRP
jgi:hypothetical protein